MLIAKAALLCITVYLVCFFAGNLVQKRENSSVGIRLCTGLMLMWALFYVCAVPIILLQPNTWGFTTNLEASALWGSNTLVKLYTVLLGAVAVAGAVRFVLELRKKEKSEEERKLLKRTEIIYLGVFLALVLFQLIKAVFYAYADGDDAYYLAVAQIMGNGENSMYTKDAYTGNPTETQIRYALAPLPIWIGYWARMFKLNAAIVNHICMQVILIPFTYIIYNLIGEKLFGDNKEKKYMFLCMVAVFVIFAHYSYYSSEVFLLTRTRQGKAALGNIIVPLLFYVFMDISSEEEFSISVKNYVRILLIAVAAMITSMFGNILVLVMLFGLFIYSFIRHSKFIYSALIALAAFPSLAALAVYFLN